MSKSLITVLVFVVLGAVIAALYRSAQTSDLPDDEWFEFENLPT